MQPLVRTEQAVQPTLPAHGQVGIGAEGAVADEEVAAPQTVVGHRGVGQVVGAQRRRQGVQQVAGVRIEQHQQMGRGETATGRLATGLSELLLKFGRIGHGEAGAVQQPDAVAMPAAVASVVVQTAVGDGAAETVKEGQGEAAAGLAVGRVGEVQTAEVAELSGGDIAVEDLLEEEVGGDHGVRVRSR